MIVRAWHGKSPESLGDEYADYIKKTGVKAYRTTEGNRGVYLLRRAEKGAAEFLLLSLWDSLASLKRFAGLDVEKAFYFPDDDKYLLEKEEYVTHYEVLFKEKT